MTTDPAHQLRAATAGTDAAGVVAHFRGPYADGPPPEALVVHPPALDRFGIEEVRRLVVTHLVLLAAVLRAVAGWLVRRRGRSLATAASEGLVEGFEQLGPTFVKLGQLIASSPSLFPAPLADACLRTLDEVRPFPPETVRALIAEELGRPVGQLFRHFDDVPLSAASIA